MKLRIIDASVAIKWFVNENRREAALHVLNDIQKNSRFYAVPELFFNEMLAVLGRLLKEELPLLKCLNLLQDLGLERLGNGRELITTATHFITKRGLTGYDAIYAACAKLTGGIWLTADEKAHHKIKSLGISQLIQ
jgi:predicted nucleic acid-binding protein